MLANCAEIRACVKACVKDYEWSCNGDGRVVSDEVFGNSELYGLASVRRRLEFSPIFSYEYRLHIRTELEGFF